MEVFVILAIIVYWIVRAGKAANAKTENSGAPQRKAAFSAGLPTQVSPKLTSEAPITKAAQARRAQMADAVQWHEAKRQQDDAAQVHSVKMDSCESKLESLRVLYEAGILDREEYAQRVSRVKSRHKER